MSKFGQELVESLTQAATHARGRKPRGVRVSKIKVSDVKAVRRTQRN